MARHAATVKPRAWGGSRIALFLAAISCHTHELPSSGVSRFLEKTTIAEFCCCIGCGDSDTCIAGKRFSSDDFLFDRFWWYGLLGQHGLYRTLRW
jgi:hypothetical protein